MFRSRVLFRLLLILVGGLFLGACGGGGGGGGSNNDDGNDGEDDAARTAATDEAANSLAASTAAANAMPAPDPTPSLKVLAIGDSNTAGVGVADPWPDKLERMIGAPVFRQGIPGEQSSGGLSRLPGALDRFQPTHVCIMEGTNDAINFVPASTTLSNIGSMIDLCRARGIDVIVGTVPPLINQAPEITTLRLEIDRGLAAVASSKGAKVARVSVALGEGTSTMQGDGIHPNDAGHNIIAMLFRDQL